MKKQTLLIASMILLSGLNAAWAAPELMAPDGPAPSDAPGLKVGDKAPDFTGANYDGDTVTLSELTAKGPVVLIFYRGAWCPFCNLHLRSFQSKLTEISAAGASVVAISVDKPEYSAKAAAESSLDFPVLSDPEGTILESYGLVYRVPEDLAAKYLNEYKIDLEAHSGRTDHLIAVPATYIIDETNTVIFAYANADYKMRATPDQVVEFLRLKA